MIADLYGQDQDEGAELLGLFSWTDKVEKRMRALLKGTPNARTVRNYDQAVRTLHALYLRGIDSGQWRKANYTAIPTIQTTASAADVPTQRAAAIIAGQSGSPLAVVFAFLAALYTAAVANEIPFAQYAPEEKELTEQARRRAGRLTIGERIAEGAEKARRLATLGIVAAVLAGAGFLFAQAKGYLPAPGRKG